MSKTLARGFDRLAPFYDSLARLFIGEGIKQSQRQFLPNLHNKKKLLILGGGTGWILPHLFEINSSLEVHYIDVSENMIARAKREISSANSIQFIVGTIDSCKEYGFDCVITNFFLDLFKDAELDPVIFRIKQRLLPEALWLVTDFVNQTRWHAWMLKVMYIFFRISTGLKTTCLPAWNSALIRAGAIKEDEKYFNRGFIQAVIFKV